MLTKDGWIRNGRYVARNNVAGQQQYWMEVNGDLNAQVALPPVPNEQQAGWSPEPFWTFRKKR